MTHELSPEEQKAAMDLVLHVVRTQGEGLDWLDDADRAEIRSALDGPRDRQALERIVAVIDRKITKAVVAAFLQAS